MKVTNRASMKILVTGAAGFIGAALCRRLLARGDQVLGVDNINDYYDVALKKARLAELDGTPGFEFSKIDIADRARLAGLFGDYQPQRVVNLAAQAGVRYSLENPHAYVDANLVGFVNMLEGCRHNDVEHLVYASSSSVYGANTVVPFSVNHNVDHPVSLYAASKKANELMAHTYSHLYQLPTTGLRYFTVYGPWGRPDMSPFLFVDRIIKGEPIQVFNNGKHIRDFTFIDDVVEGTVLALDRPAQAEPDWGSAGCKPSTSSAPYRIYNIGNENPVKLMDYIAVIEDCVGKKAVKEFVGKQAGDVDTTHADVSESKQDLGYRPATSLRDGMQEFVNWYKAYYKISI